MSEKRLSVAVPPPPVSARSAVPATPAFRDLASPPPDAPAGPFPDLPAPVPPKEDPGAGLARFLRLRGVGPVALAFFGTAFAATATLVFLVGHAGIAGVLSVVALVSGHLARLPDDTGTRAPEELPRVLVPLIDLLVATGAVMGVVTLYPPVAGVLALAVLVLMLWLPVVAEVVGPTRRTVPHGLWTRGERMGVLLAGGLVGRPVPALLALAVVLGLEAWLALAALAHPSYLPPRDGVGPAWARALLGPDGTLKPAVRWTSLAVTLALLFVAPRSGLWKF